MTIIRRKHFPRPSSWFMGLKLSSHACGIHELTILFSRLTIAPPACGVNVQGLIALFKQLTLSAPVSCCVDGLTALFQRKTFSSRPSSPVIGHAPLPRPYETPSSQPVGGQPEPAGPTPFTSYLLAQRRHLAPGFQFADLDRTRRQESLRIRHGPPPKNPGLPVDYRTYWQEQWEHYDSAPGAHFEWRDVQPDRAAALASAQGRSSFVIWLGLRVTDLVALGVERVVHTFLGLLVLGVLGIVLWEIFSLGVRIARRVPAVLLWILVLVQKVTVACIAFALRLKDFVAYAVALWAVDEVVQPQNRQALGDK